MGHVQNICPVNICAYTERILTMHGDIYELFCVNVWHLGLSYIDIQWVTTLPALPHAHVTTKLGVHGEGN